MANKQSENGSAGNKASPGAQAGGSAGPAAAEAQQGKIDKITAMGNAVWLMTQSPLHRNLLVSDVDWMLVPPCAFGQFRLWRNENSLPLAFATWAFVSDEVLERLRGGRNVRIKPDEWRSGETPVLMDLIFPWGGHEEGLKELRGLMPGLVELGPK